MLLYNWLERTVKNKGSARALIYRDTYLSWRGLLHRVDRRASEFTAMGLKAGDLVGLMLGNVPDFLILSLALSKLRCAALPMDPTTSTRELEMLMSLVPVRGLITRPRGGDAPLPSAQQPGESNKPTRRSTLAGRHAPESRKRLQGTLLSCAIYPRAKKQAAIAGGESIGVVLVTADSAGDPKPVERSFSNLEAEAKQLGEALRLTGDDRALLTVPLFSSFGFDLGMVACLQAGATLCLEDEIGPARVMKFVREHKVTLLPGTQTLFAELARLPATRSAAVKGTRFLSLGGGLTGSLLDAFYEKYGSRPSSCMHTTETGTVSLDPKGQAGHSVGKPLPGVEVRVTDPVSGKPLPSGRSGAFWVRSAALSPLQLAAAPVGTDAVAVGTTDHDGWYRTGDIVTMDRAKRIVLDGREDDLVRLDGKRIALGEVEGCIESLPKVSAAEAKLITDHLGGPMVIARVVLKDRRHKVDPESIIDHCARNLAPYKVPRRIEICEAL